MAERGSGRSFAKRSSIWLATGALFLLISLGLPWWRPSTLPETFPPNVEQLDRQIWAAGVADHFPTQYAAFHQQVSDLRQHWRVEISRWWPSWTVEEFDQSYNQLMNSGSTLLAAGEKKKRSQQSRLREILAQEQAQLARLRNLNGLFDLRGKRTALSRAESFLSQGRIHLNHGRVESVPRLLAEAQTTMDPIETTLIQQMSRYTDSQNIAQWNRWITDALAESRTTGGLVLVVEKAAQEFRLYQKGLLRRRFPTDLGYSGLQDKLYEGDGATPEGIFQIIRKKQGGETKFYKAFMLDFPTPLHERRFRLAKAKGLIPGNRGIGGLIEIHGQRSAQRDLTNGCVALDNAIMDLLFPLVPLKTPVVIVGALDPMNSVSEALTPIQRHHMHRESVNFPTVMTLSRAPVQ